MMAIVPLVIGYLGYSWVARPYFSRLWQKEGSKVDSPSSPPPGGSGGSYQAPPPGQDNGTGGGFVAPPAGESPEHAAWRLTLERLQRELDSLENKLRANNGLLHPLEEARIQGLIAQKLAQIAWMMAHEP